MNKLELQRNMNEIWLPIWKHKFSVVRLTSLIDGGKYKLRYASKMLEFIAVKIGCSATDFCRGMCER